MMRPQPDEPDEMTQTTIHTNGHSPTPATAPDPSIDLTDATLTAERRQSTTSPSAVPKCSSKAASTTRAGSSPRPGSA